MPEITIAIPFYNAEEYFEQAILSVLSQTFTDFTLLLIDDGSTDSSLKIAQKYLEDKRVVIISDGKNLNLGYRLNEIPHIAKTEYLARMDADDIMHPERIEKQLKILKENPDIDVLGSNAYSIDENNNVVGKRINISDDSLILVSTFTHPTIIAKTQWFRDNPYDVEAIRIEDSELWLRTKNQYTFKTIGEPLLFYREIGNKYYKKYLKGLPGIWYMVKKHSFSFEYSKFSSKYLLSCIVYFIFDLLGRESILIQNRNEVKINKKDYKFFI
ncbi:glycosyltransferase family 2 protein [Chryseobacterium daecheongense]|uniref:Glycosyltransferase family 2 protein n=1 Tax=Chryseobacterium daecheongense TaxID=192389 RepID=A0A3N0W641_9FLAO|nr:glycosyltransferase family 2 protein [Chryseobacterium daecheongense]ROI00522.1 glycosyltransferase family 2 protein [Chryseobacterium daecheongense]TDX94502.1 glycosyltransferase involved in cell wall biosynthesis [Chryseobacterium daecheongense]